MKISDSVYTLKQPLEEIVFPEIQPYQEDYLQVSDLHSLWFAQYGNPQGVPIIILHGGPGFGCSLIDMRYCDPSYYRIILLDQRGAKRSKPIGETQQNTASYLIDDLESLRKHLNIQQWFLFGGSWGSLLAILYGEAYPEHCLGFILRGIFLGRQSDIHNVWYGMQDVYPERWDEFQKFLPADERSDLINNYYDRLMDPDPNIHWPAVRALSTHNLNASCLMPSPQLVEKFLENTAQALAVSRIFTLYSKNNCFIEENQPLNNISRIQHLPAIIVHGRYDMICKAKNAYDLHQNWPGSELIFVQDAGHSALEPGISKALLEVSEKMKSYYKSQLGN